MWLTLDDGGVAGWTVPMVTVVVDVAAVHGCLWSRSCRSPARTGSRRRSDDVSRGIRDVDDEDDDDGVDMTSVLAGS